MCAETGGSSRECPSGPENPIAMHKKAPHYAGPFRSGGADCAGML